MNEAGLPYAADLKLRKNAPIHKLQRIKDREIKRNPRRCKFRTVAPPLDWKDKLNEWDGPVAPEPYVGDGKKIQRLLQEEQEREEARNRELRLGKKGERGDPLKFIEGKNLMERLMKSPLSLTKEDYSPKGPASEQSVDNHIGIDAKTRISKEFADFETDPEVIERYNFLETWKTGHSMNELELQYQAFCKRIGEY